MLKKIINLQRYTIIFLLVFVSAGCGDSNKGPSWTFFRDAALKEKLENKKVVSTQELENTFSRYVDVMENIVALCDQYPAIERVGIKGSIDYYGEPAALDVKSLNAVVDAMRGTLSTIGASSLMCGRRGDYDDNPLSNVSFVMYAVGLSVSGQGKKIVYFTDWANQHSPLTETDFQATGYKPLNKPSWYIYESE